MLRTAPVGRSLTIPHAELLLTDSALLYRTAVMLVQTEQRLEQWGKKAGPSAADVLSNDWGSGEKKPADG